MLETIFSLMIFEVGLRSTLENNRAKNGLKQGVPVWSLAGSNSLRRKEKSWTLNSFFVEHEFPPTPPLPFQFCRWRNDGYSGVFCSLFEMFCLWWPKTKTKPPDELFLDLSLGYNWVWLITVMLVCICLMDHVNQSVKVCVDDVCHCDFFSFLFL